MMTKAQSERRHFQRRAEERLGVSLSRDEVRQIVEFIQSGGAQFVERQSKRCTLWGVCIRGADCVVVYDKKRKQPVTVLRREWFDNAPKAPGGP